MVTLITDPSEADARLVRLGPTVVYLFEYRITHGYLHLRLTGASYHSVLGDLHLIGVSSISGPTVVPTDGLRVARVSEAGSTSLVVSDADGRWMVNCERVALSLRADQPEVVEPSPSAASIDVGAAPTDPAPTVRSINELIDTLVARHDLPNEPAVGVEIAYFLRRRAQGVRNYKVSVKPDRFVVTVALEGGNGADGGRLAQDLLTFITYRGGMVSSIEEGSDSVACCALSWRGARLAFRLDLVIRWLPAGGSFAGA
jgi:hypothetical protein